MSEMEIFYGEYRLSNQDLEPEDTDEFFEVEESLGMEFVKVNDSLYEYREALSVNVRGIPEASPGWNAFSCYWYNGGASRKEMVASLIAHDSEVESKKEVSFIRWRSDVENMPKDGTTVLAWFDLDGLSELFDRAVPVYWNNSQKRWNFSGRSASGYSEIYKPTHWCEINKPEGT